METKTLAIVIANYNGYEDTLKCLESLMTSDYKDFFVVLVDDASTEEKSSCLDDEWLVENTGLDIIFHRCDDNHGFAGANNIGIKLALSHNPEYIMLLNNDTYIYPDTIGKLLSHADSKRILAPKILSMADETILYSAGGFISSVSYIPGNTGAGEKDKREYASERVCPFVSFCCVVIPAGVFGVTGYLDENYYMYSEDVDYCLRASDNGYICRYIPEAVILHKDGGTGVSRSRRGVMYGIRNECIIREKYFKDGMEVNKKMYIKTKLEYIVRKLTFRKNKDNETYYKALKAYMKGSCGREPLFDVIDG